MNTAARLVLSSTVGTAVFIALLFGPAGTFDYWQGWTFFVVFGLSTWPPSLYLMRTNPAALQRRMRAGPLSETRMRQKFLVSLAFLSMAALIVFSVLDHRFGWSPVPGPVSLVGDLLVAAGLGMSMLVVVQNSYAAATVTVEPGQTLVSTGLYGLVRHPMYTGSVVMMVGIPLALGSYWGLSIVVPAALVLVLRIRDEEQLLTEELDGYREYRRQVRYRLVPYLW